MSKLTKEDLYFLHDAVKQNPFWTNGTKYGLTVLNSMCEQLIKFKVELFKYLGVRKDDEWMKNSQIVLVDACTHDVNHEMWYIRNGWHDVIPNTVIMLQAYLQNLHLLLDEKIPEKPIGYTVSTSFLVKHTTVQNEDGTYRCVTFKNEDERPGLITYYQRYIDKCEQVMKEHPEYEVPYPTYYAKELELLKSDAKVTQYHIFED
jgi:hypothetical protein